MTSASAGSSLSVGMSDLLQRIRLIQCRLKIAKCKSQNYRPSFFTLHFSICTLHFALSSFLLGDEPFDFFHQGVDDLGFGNFADDLASLEDQADALAAGNAEIGGARLTRTIDLAAHHCDVDI